MSYKSIGFKPGEEKKIKYIADMTGLTRTGVIRSILVTEFSQFDRENKDKNELQMSFKKSEEGHLKTVTVMINDDILKKMKPYLDITELSYSSFIRALVIPVINMLYEDIKKNGVNDALRMAINSNIGKIGDIK
ncbi:MAG: hypothetical protein H2184_15875 [Candidatus Galacturonibacter soehngenii]|nr:hypothetical protein [Candidatus Galacturonibacter soehngenii]